MIARLSCSSSEAGYELMDEKPCGLNRLLRASSPKSFHDSSARYPPPRCHPGTRSIQREYLTQWASSDANRLLWLKGPAGVGKSAIAQTCAEELGTRLGASFFFSKPNHTDDPLSLFPSIAYQLSQILAPYGHVLDQEIRHDPSIVEKPLHRQFQEIIARPSQEFFGGERPKLVIFIDGLDECRGPAAQVEIVKILASSVRDATTPFLWAVCSRPEAHLVDAFSSTSIAPVCLYMDVPAAFDEVERFIVDKLRSIGQRSFNFPPSSAWPPNEAVATLVKLSCGNFACASTMIDYIGQSRTDGPDSRLRTVLDLEQTLVLHDSDPLSYLDHLYMLIMSRLPLSVLSTAREILFATTLPGIRTSAHSIANLLHLSELQFRESLRDLHPVVTIVPTSMGPEVSFRHASFFDFLADPRRSHSFSWRPTCALTLRNKLLQRLEDFQRLRNPTHASVDSLLITWRRGGRNYYDQYGAQQNCVTAFTHLCQLAPLDDEMLVSLAGLDFSTLCLFWDHIEVQADMTGFLHSIPGKVQGSIIRYYTKSASTLDDMYKPPDADRDFSFILGHGSRKAFCWGKEGCNYFWIAPYPKHRLLDYVKRFGSRQIKGITSLVHVRE